MNRNLVAASIVAAAAALGANDAALAADSGWYATAIGGLNLMSDRTFDVTGPGGGRTSQASLDSGFLAGGAIGYAFDDRWRVEAEFTYQTVEHGGLTLPGGVDLPGGNYASTALAINGLYDFNLFGSERARSYLGAGLAWLTEVDVDFEQGGSEQSFSGDDFGLLLLAGARYDVGERLYLDAGVRYLVATGIELEGEAGAAGTLEADYEPWSVTLGIGWRF